MNRVFVICNQHEQFLAKSGEWGDGSENRSIYRTPHKDEALNRMVELTVKDPNLRARICEIEKTEKDVLQLPAHSEERSMAADEAAISEGTTADGAIPEGLVPQSTESELPPPAHTAAEMPTTEAVTPEVVDGNDTADNTHAEADSNSAPPLDVAGNVELSTALDADQLAQAIPETDTPQQMLV